MKTIGLIGGMSWESTIPYYRVIYDELCLGIVRKVSRDAYREIISRLVSDGAQAVILGCTEIQLLVKSQDSEIPLFDSTAIHASIAAEKALAP